MKERKFLDIDMDNFDKRMAAIEPAVSMEVSNKLGPGEGGEKLSVNLKFTQMDDFLPAAIGRQAPAMAKPKPPWRPHEFSSLLSTYPIYVSDFG
jgi:type VI secretion system protein ImpB